MLSTTTKCAGPEELIQLKTEHLVPCVYHFYKRPPHIVGSEGCYLIGHRRERYLDCYCGVTVMNAGHCNPAIIEPAIEQIRTLQHTTTIYLTEPMLRLAQTLAEITPGGLRRSFFCASGSEAVEGALWSASLHTGRSEVVAMHNGLHGRTRWAMSLTGLSMWRTDPQPLGGVHHIPFGDVEAVRDILEARADRIAAVVAEPIQGNGGVRIPENGYWPAVRRLCDEHGVLLVFDEVQTGFGRTGRWFACEHWGVAPDVMAVGKALGNGFPIAAFVTTDAVAASCTRPGASTFGGNPVASAAALATIEYHRSHGLAGRSERLGAQGLDRLRGMSDRHGCLAHARGRGLMLAVDLVDGDSRPNAERLDAVLEALKDRGYLCGKTGPERNVLTIMPPLVVERAALDTLFEALDAVLQETEGI